jgi:signal transduction histidine kinase
MLNFWRNLSLRSRLTTLSVGLLASLLTVLSGVLYFNLRRFLFNNTALRVRAQAKPIIERNLAQIHHNDLSGIAKKLSRELTSRDTTASVFDKNGRFLSEGRRLPEEPVAARSQPEHVARALSGEKDITYTGLQNNSHAQVALIPLRHSPKSPEVIGVVQLTTPLDQVEILLSRQKRMLGLGVILTLGLGILGELWITRTALAPLKNMVDTIRRITGGDLSRRTQLPHTGDEVGQLAAAFDHMAGSLEVSFESQSRFVSAAAHELRTPLTALQGSLEVLQHGAQDDPTATRSLLQGMHREVTRLGRLTEQLLALTRMDAPEVIHFRRINLAALLDDIFQQTKFLVNERRFNIVRGPAVDLEADPDLLTQVFLNLIDNAVQHTGPDDVLELGWSADEHSVSLWVVDNGEGIAPDDLPHIFEAFYRADRSRSHRRGGAGLGLAIVQTIIRAHTGKIEVDSQPGRGTRFNIVLPRRRIG